MKEKHSHRKKGAKTFQVEAVEGQAHMKSPSIEGS